MSKLLPTVLPSTDDEQAPTLTLPVIETQRCDTSMQAQGKWPG